MIETHKRSSSYCARFAVSLVLFAVLLATWSPSASAAAPRISSLNPDRGPVGTTVFILGSNFGPPTELSVVLFNGVPAETPPERWLDNLIVTSVPEGATTGPVVVQTPQGTSNGVNFTVLQPNQRWYLAEGSTGWGFETFVLIENTEDVDATVNITYNTQQYGRIPRPNAITVPASSRVTLNVNEDFGGVGVDVSTVVNSSGPVVCERSMYWGDRVEGHDSIGVMQPGKVWYLAEGCTRYPFETWLLIGNPGNTDANVDVSYMTSRGNFQKSRFTLGAGMRYTIDVSKDVGECDVSAMVTADQDVVCERAMYWNERRGGHDSIGVTEASKTWYLAEGTTAWGFETWLLIQNPGDQTATVNVTYMTPYGPKEEPALTMPPRSRSTLRVNDKVKNMDTSIEVQSDKAVIAERSMYWDNGTGVAGHNTVGMVEPAGVIYLAEGSTAWGFETFVCLQNPNHEQVDVGVTYMTNDGAVKGGDWAVPPGGRVTIYMNNQLPNKDASIRLVCAKPIMAERPMYWNARGGGHVSIGWAP